MNNDNIYGQVQATLGIAIEAVDAAEHRPTPHLQYVERYSAALWILERGFNRANTFDEDYQPDTTLANVAHLIVTECDWDVIEEVILTDFFDLSLETVLTLRDGPDPETGGPRQRPMTPEEQTEWAKTHDVFGDEKVGAHPFNEFEDQLTEDLGPQH